MLRIERGISKASLARSTGTSRQQLWRVMTGRSALTRSFARQLGVVLGVAPEELQAIPAGRMLTVSYARRPRPASATPTAGSTVANGVTLTPPEAVDVAGFWPVWRPAGPREPGSGKKGQRRGAERRPRTLAEFLADSAALGRAINALPDDGPGARVRQDLIAALRREAAHADLPLPDGLDSAR